MKQTHVAILSVVLCLSTLLGAAVHAQVAQTPKSNVRFSMVSVVETGSGQRLMSDGLGPYIDGVDHVNTYYVASPTSARDYVLYATESDVDRKPIRALSYDYSSPRGGGAIDRGIILKDSVGRVRVYPYAGVITDIPVGASVAAGRVEILQSWTGLDGTRYCLVFSSRNTTGGFTGADGTGSTDVMINRISSTEWRIVAPPGSVGRLWQLDSNRQPQLDLGYYNFAFSISANQK